MLTKANESRDDTDYYAHMKKKARPQSPTKNLVLSPPKGSQGASSLMFRCENIHLKIILQRDTRRRRCVTFVN